MKLICATCGCDWKEYGKQYLRLSSEKIDYRCTKCKSKRKPIEYNIEDEMLKEEATLFPYKKEIKIKKEETNNKLHITCSSYHIKTLDDLISHSNIDTSIWEIDKFITNSWETTMSGKKSSTNCDQTYTNYQIKAWWKKKQPKQQQITYYNSY